MTFLSFKGALGVRVKATTEERENERRVLREARGKFLCTVKHFLNSLLTQKIILLILKNFFLLSSKNTEKKLLAAKQREEMWNN